MAINLSKTIDNTQFCVLCAYQWKIGAHQQIPQNKSRAKASNESKEEEEMKQKFIIIV